MKHLALIIALAFGSTLYAQDETELTNDKVIEMVNAGIPSSVIITKIKNSKVRFVTDTQGLKALTDAKVPEGVVSAMIEQSVVKQPETLVTLPTSTPTPIEKPKVQSPPFTPYSQLSKQEQKLRMKSPAQISIAAPMDKVSQLLVRGFQSWNYQLDNESTRSLSFTRQAKSFGADLIAGMIGNNNVRHRIQVSMSEVSGITNVIVNISLQMDNAFGKTTNERLNKKDDRAQLDDLLLRIKKMAEKEQ